MIEQHSTQVYATLGEQTRALDLHQADGGTTLRFEAPAGLYQFSVIADARDFEWEDLYIELNAYHNTGQRTGPWDFHPTEGAKPLVPSYWVFIDGRKIGLWFFQRVSLEDIEGRRFRGRMAFHLAEPGEHELKFVPYRPIALRWVSARLENDPEDSLLPNLEAVPRAPLPAQRWARPEFWESLRRQLDTTHAIYAEPLKKAFAYIDANDEFAPNQLIVLLAAHRLKAHDGALQKLLSAIDANLDLEHWGNPREDGYSHDGDMHAAFPLRAMAWMYHALGNELGEARRERMRAKIALQGRRFFDLALLNRDYWGGSLLQDHGWFSQATYATAVLHLLGVVPEAALWASYSLPRVRRGFAAMPRDGVVPASSHSSLSLFLDAVGDYRDTLLAFNGEDIYDDYPFHKVVDFTANVYARAAPAYMLGANHFFNHMAVKYHDATAAWVQQRLLCTPELEWSHFMQLQAYYPNIVRGLLTYDPSNAAAEPAPPPALQFYPDSGLAHFHDAANDITFLVRCGPWCGHHSDRTATGPCDRMAMSVMAGHFTLRRGITDLLASPDQGYSLRGTLGSCLLVDGGGQYGDIGYPMSIPSFRHPGHEIESVHWDNATHTGLVRLNLAPAYTAASGVTHYTREFVIGQGQIVCRDCVVLSEPKTLSWLFQGKRETGVALESGLRARLGGDNGVSLEALPQGLDLQTSMHQTPIVWSYSSGSGYKPFDHIRFDTREPVEQALVEFRLTW